MRTIAVNLSILFFIVLFQVSGNADTINVPADYGTIQEAIDAAVSGDTIVIAAGDYEEQLLIDGKDITLQGAGAGVTNVLSPEILAVSFATSADNKCVIGVINGASPTLSDLTVDGQGRGNANVRFEGIGFRNSGGTVTDCDIIDIQDTPFSGTQHGVGVYAYNDNGTDYSIDLTNCAVVDYQKTAIALSGENVIATVTNCTTTGIGPTSVTAQNGIQLSYGASGTVDGCTVTGNCYTGGYWVATGILLYEADTVNVVNCPSIADNQMGTYFITTSGTFSDNTLTAGVNSHGGDEYYWGLGIDDLGAHQPQVSVFGDGEGTGDSRNPTAVNVSHCTFDADQTGYGTGIGAWAAAGDNLEATITACRISGWEWGVEVWDDGTALPTVQIFGCDIFDNVDYGIINYTTSVVIAQYNWWGHESGPYNLQWNPDGQGDNVSDLVWFWPWLESSDYLTVPWDHGTIQAAIDAAPNGGTVVVAPGDYEEQLFVDGKSVSVLGAGKGVTKILSPAVLAVTFVTSVDNKCIVGVINGGHLTIKNLTVDGQGLGNSNYRFNGVGFRNTGGVVENCEVLNIQDTPFSGTQHGVAVYAYNNDGTDHEIEVTDCELIGYQKNGMALNGDNVIAKLTNCTTEGIGQTGITAQNGIQIAYDADGTVENCTIEGNCYTGGTWTASGFLLYDADQVDIIDCPSIADNQTGVYYIQTSGLFSGCNLTAGVNAHGQTGTYWGLIAGEEGERGNNTLAASVFGDGQPSDKSRKAADVVTVSNSTFIADETGEGYALVAGATTGNSVTLDVTYCTIQQWALGVYSWNAGTGISNVSVHDCDISNNNLIGGVVNDTTKSIDARANWWGHYSGPYHLTKNPTGQGNQVSDYVNFKPFYNVIPKEPDLFDPLDVPGDYSTIQAAVDAAQNGDVIIVEPGDYEEQITVDGKTVTIMGKALGPKPVILCPPLLETSFVTSSDNKCIVAVINDGDLTLNNMTIDGRGYGNDNYKFSGIGFRNSGGAVVSCNIFDIQDTPFSGTQHGVAIYAYNNDGTDRHLLLRKCLLTGYQKNGMALNGENTVVTVRNCITEGIGPTNVTAQNGIQLGYGARGILDRSSVRDHCYTGPDWTATGILLYQGGLVTVENSPYIESNQTGVYFVETSGLYDNNTLTADLNSHGNDGSYVGLGIDAHGAHGMPSSPFVDATRVKSPRNGTTVIVSNSSFIADQSGTGLGIGCWAQYGDNIVVDIVDSEIRDWVVGVEIWDDGSAVPTVDISNCSITGNVDYGVINYTEELVLAEYNWWGDPSGPYHPDTNPSGLGDAVEGYVWIWNWLNSDPWAD